MAINPKIKQKAEDIRSKIFGSEVRESLASGIEAISEDVEATIGRQDYVEEQFQNVIDETTDKDVISAPELIAARNGKSNLKTRLDEEHAQVTAQLQQTEQELSLQLAQKANKSEVDVKISQIKDGSVKGVFLTFADLTNAYPNGDDNIYVVTDNGYWYFWNESEWVNGGVYQSTGYDKYELYDRLGLPNISDDVTVENALVYNNFESTLGWSAGNATDYTVTNNVATFTATAANGRIATGVNVVPNHVYYIKASIKSTSDQVSLYVAGSNNNFHSGSGVFEEITFLYTPSLTTVSLRVEDKKTSNWQPVQVKKIVVADLTEAFGIGNEPSLVEMDILMDYLPDKWFSETTDIPNTLINKNTVIANYEGRMVMLPFEHFANNENGEVGETSGNMLEGKKIVFFGDSVTEFGNYPEVAGQKTGADVINVGVGGTCMVRHTAPGYDAFSMTNLADAIASGDWSAQIANKVTALGDDNSEIVDRMTGIDWNTVDILCIAHGTNDYKGGYDFGNAGDFGKSSFLGGLPYIVETILSAYPHLLVMFITPTWRKFNGEDGDLVPNGKGKYIVDYVDAIKDNAEKYKLPALDMYRTSGINKFTETVYLASGGDVHPSTKGYVLFGEKVGAFLLSHF